MCELAWEHSPDVRQIDLDVNRTYREHINFRKRYNFKQQELFNILSAYSIYNLDIGYTQGMSQIAALLLMYLSEDEAFWALSTLISDSKYYMHGKFSILINIRLFHKLKSIIKLISLFTKHKNKNVNYCFYESNIFFFVCLKIIVIES